ncbi:hypothetical protein [Ectothiorhodosinus mongolicus]|uniref:hypothetical protein n=1 Tax=Ectothiorhodosinus mongolicus TaxID=233100 RepID=UPI001356509E|nr:hypothetical protein [Ectothiorhodosinus mongolicus]
MAEIEGEEQSRKWATGIIKEFTMKIYAMAERNIPMTMQDWETRLNHFLEAANPAPFPQQ